MKNAAERAAVAQLRRVATRYASAADRVVEVANVSRFVADQFVTVHGAQHVAKLSDCELANCVRNYCG